ncbi:MAG TPA: hypothetical protein VFX11_04815, partial [Candidatus Kapabacteria bacterium]|nr:hypothetical protein [Candidatus Kapabacteria bacterium]
GYVGFFDPVTQDVEQWAPADDALAHKRMDIKGRLASGRGYMRKNSKAVVSNERRHQASLEQGNSKKPAPAGAKRTAAPGKRRKG